MSGAKTHFRAHKFPPLRKTWQVPAASNALNIDPVEYQRQLVEGFQEGVEKGYQQGIEQGRDEGRQEGYKEGAQLGYNEGLARGEQEGRVHFAQASEPFDRLTKNLDDYLADYEIKRREELLQLVEKVTRQVIRCELSLQPTQLLALVEEALNSLPHRVGEIKVLLNQEEYERINDIEPEKVKLWGLMPEPDMPQGECRIITETTEMDVGCEHRLQQCIEVLEGSLTTESLG